MQMTLPKGQHQYIYTFISLDACSESNLLLDKGTSMSTWSVYLDGRAWSESQLHSSSPYPFSTALYQQSAFFPLRKAEFLPVPTFFQVAGGFCTRLDEVFAQVPVLCPSVELSGCLEQFVRANQAYSTFPSSKTSWFRDTL